MRSLPMLLFALVILVTFHSATATHQPPGGMDWFLEAATGPIHEVRAQVLEDHGAAGPAWSLSESAPCIQFASLDAPSTTTTVPAQDVHVHVEFTAAPNVAPVLFTFGVGRLDRSGVVPTYTSVAGATALPQGTSSFGFADATFPYPGATFTTDEHIASSVCIEFGDDGVFSSIDLAAGGGASYARYMGDDNPPWPVPELGTLALAAVGLLGVDWMALRRR